MKTKFCKVSSGFMLLLCFFIPGCSSSPEKKVFSPSSSSRQSSFIYDSSYEEGSLCTIELGAAISVRLFNGTTVVWPRNEPIKVPCGVNTIIVDYLGEGWQGEVSAATLNLYNSYDPFYRSLSAGQQNALQGLNIIGNLIKSASAKAQNKKNQAANAIVEKTVNTDVNMVYTFQPQKTYLIAAEKIGAGPYPIRIIER